MADDTIPKYSSRNFSKIKVTGDGDCGYYTLIHGLLTIFRENPDFDLKGLEGLALSTARPIIYPEWAVDFIKDLLGVDYDHWLETDDFPTVTTFWDICILTWDRHQKLWWHHKSQGIWESLPGLLGCPNVLFFHHQLTKSGAGDHWSLLELKTEWNPPDVPIELIDYYYHEDLKIKLSTKLRTGLCYRDHNGNYRDPASCRRLLIEILNYILKTRT